MYASHPSWALSGYGGSLLELNGRVKMYLCKAKELTILKAWVLKDRTV